MNKNSKLTQFNEGGLHSQNPLGGVPIGNNASVEQGETLKDNFVYSNQIFLDENSVTQYNLPKSLIGKSVADATKFIDNKFKGRNDKISQSTKDLMLSKIAEAQESMKPQEPEVEPQDLSEDMINSNQMTYEGYVKKFNNGGFMQYDTFDPNQKLGYQFGQTNNMNPQSIAQQDAGMDGEGPSPQAVIGAAGTALDLGRLAFGKSQIDTSGAQASQDVNAGGMIAGNTLKGASAGTAIMPGLGTAIGAGVGAIAGLLGSKKAKKAALRNSTNFALKTNAQFSDQYEYGGTIDPNDSHLMPDGTSMLNSEMITKPINSNPIFNTKNIVRYQPGVTSGKDGSSGFYLYSKLPTEAGFNYERDREFVRNENMGALQRTPQWQTYMKNKSIQPKQFAKGGKLTPLDTTLTSKPFEEPIFNSPSFSTSKMITDLSKPVNTENPSLGNYLNYGVKETGNFFKNNIKNTNFGNLARYAPIAMNAYQLSQLKKPQGEVLDRLGNRYKPQYVDEAALQNIANQNINNTINAISQSGASEGQIRASILGSQLQRTKALSDAYNQAAAVNRATDDRAQTFNLGVDQVNLNQSNTEKDINARNIGNYDTQKSRLLSQLGSDIGNVGREEVYKDIAKNTTGYKWTGEYVKSPSGNIVTDPDTGKPMTKEKLEEIQKSKETNKKALGGYLMKNKK